MIDFCVNISVKNATDIIKNNVANYSISGELLNEYNNDFATVLVFEQYYFRAGRITLTVIIDTHFGKTHIHAISAGGKDIFGVDLGASKDFENCVINALYQYVIA